MGHVKSKRQTLHQKHKVLKKIAEHQRQQRREAKRNPNKRMKLKKDPGVPNLWPFKEQFMDKVQEDKAKAEEAAQLARMEKRQQIAELRRRADAAGEEYEERNHEINEEARYIDSSRRSFMKEFKKVVKAADVIIEVLDARDPLGTRCPEIERQILEADPKKKIVLVLNKIDLVSRENLEAWLKVLRNELPTVAFKASTQHNRSNIGQNSHNIKHKASSSNEVDYKNVTECLGASTLIGLLKNYARSKDIKLSITVGIIGIPNVGKSSLINSLKRERAVGVGATPGFTKSMQEVVLDKNLKLLDCPGIIFTSATSEAEAALRNAVKIEQLIDPIAPVELIMSKCTMEQLCEIYEIAAFTNVVELLTAVAKKRGKIKPGGVIDIDSAAKVVIQDWNGGKIPYMSRPPRDISQISAEIVPAWSEEFNIAAIASLEAERVIQQVPDKPSVQFVEIAPSTSLGVDQMLLADDVATQNGDSDGEEYSDDDDNMMDADDMETDGESGDESAEEEQEPAPKPSAFDLKAKSSRELKEASKKASLQEKKRKREQLSKKSSSKNGESSEEEDDEKYDFGTDFWGNVPASQVRESSSKGVDFDAFSM